MVNERFFHFCSLCHLFQVLSWPPSLSMFLPPAQRSFWNLDKEDASFLIFSVKIWDYLLLWAFNFFFFKSCIEWLRWTWLFEISPWKKSGLNSIWKMFSWCPATWDLLVYSAAIFRLLSKTRIHPRTFKDICKANSENSSIYFMR